MADMRIICKFVAILPKKVIHNSELNFNTFINIYIKTYVMDISHIEHVGIAVTSLDEAIPFYEKMLGFKCFAIEEVADQKVRTAFFKVGQTKIELLEAKSVNTVSSYLASSLPTTAVAAAFNTLLLLLKMALQTLLPKLKAKAVASSTRLLAKVPKA